MSLAMATGASSDHAMKAIMASPSPSTSSSAAAADGVLAFSDDCFDFEDGCSICLEPFSSHDPPTVTNCKHEYHLHCILEWSQRSSECPICCQLLVLKDPASQELLNATKSERSLRSKKNIRIGQEDNEVSHVAVYVNDSDLEERILHHFAAAMGRTRYDAQRRRHTSSGRNSSEVLSSVSFATMSNLHSNHSHDEMENVNYVVEVGSTATTAPGATTEPELSPTLSAENGDGPVNHRILFGQSSPDGPQRSSSSEFIAFSESVKAKLSAASARYKESITKSTRGFKERLLARNSTVKELGRGVQREMSAGIAGVARMMERFDLSSRRAAGVSAPFSNSSAEKQNLADSGQSLVQTAAAESPGVLSGETMHSSDMIPPFNSSASIAG